jgi:secondary thiamine-phosphate synthase enzyme
MFQESFVIPTTGRGFYEATAKIAALVRRAQIRTGLCHVFCRHTSASVLLCENADPAVLEDLEAFFARLVPDGDSSYLHDAEGPDDMPAHVRTVLTQSSLTIPITDGRLALGPWQGLFLYEHRSAGHRRELIVSISG